jgi:beta-lactamase superfamily II metal-dependent hydrolase
VIRHPGDEHKERGRISFVDINDWKDRKPDDESAVAGLSQFLKSNYDGGTGIFKSQISEEEYAEEYLNDPVDYYQDNVEDRHDSIWRFISTHPDMDHLSGLNRLREEVGISGLWDTDHNKEMDEEDEWGPGFEPEDWEAYTEIRNDETSHFYIQPTEGDQGDFWEQDNIEILHPTPEFVQEINEENADAEKPEFNDISLVLLLETRAGSVLLPGDAEQDAWDRILEEHEEKLDDIRVLKAAHHGREDGFYQEAVEAMDPEYVVLSVGKKPSTDAHSDYTDVCRDDAKVISTRQHGRVKFTITKRGTLIRSLEYPDGIFDLPGE